RGASWIAGYFLPLLPWIIGVKLAVWLAMGLHRGTWRYTGLGDAVRLLAGSLIALGLVVAGYNGWQMYLLTRQGAGNSLTRLPETLFMLDALFGLILIGGMRMAARMV